MPVFPSCWERQEVTEGHLTLWVPETTVKLQDFRPLFGQHQPCVQHACNTGQGSKAGQCQMQILSVYLSGFYSYMHFAPVHQFSEKFKFYSLQC